MHYGQLIQDLLRFLLCFILLREGILSYNESIVKSEFGLQLLH